MLTGCWCGDAPSQRSILPQQPMSSPSALIRRVPGRRLTKVTGVPTLVTRVFLVTKGFASVGLDSHLLFTSKLVPKAVVSGEGAAHGLL